MLKKSVLLRMISMDIFDYPLPDERIARFPVNPRDTSRLLVYREGNMEHRIFSDLPSVLPAGSLLVLNETRVVPARLFLQHPKGKNIEVFVLGPADPELNAHLALQQKGECTFHCLIGGRKTWKEGEILQARFGNISLQCRYADREQNHVHFSWEPAALSFAEVLESAGNIPLPPYINRNWEESDRETYQTVYSRLEGSVAAPTAGLHFTPEVFEALHARGIHSEYTTLHVGAGTFMPVKTENALEHTMHSEQIVISDTLLQRILEQEGPVIAVGTTSCRLLESMYWFGVKLESDPQAAFRITQDDAYTLDPLPREKALRNMLRAMQERNIREWTGHSALYILPGYTFRVVKGLITNFHQPKSTLLLLVSALIGDDWKNVYASALENGYRFLSYGDSSLLLPQTMQ